jgi:hypothetical protein
MAAEPVLAKRGAGRVRGWLSALGFREIFWIAVVAILAVTALFGGLDSVNTKVTQIKVGEPFSDGEFTITIQRASAVSELRAGGMLLAPPSPGHRYLGVVATVRNDGTVPGQLMDELDLRNQRNSEFFNAFRINDGSQISTLGPRLTETIAFLWTLPDSELQPGATVTLRVWRKQYREAAVNYGKVWLDSIDEYGEIEVPVQVKA